MPLDEVRVIWLGVFAWMALFGLWPLLDTGHDVTTGPLVWIDLYVHGLGVLGIAMLALRGARR